MPRPERFDRILVVQTAFIGDAILATALLEKLRRFYPDAQLDLLVRKGNESLFKGHPFLHEVLIWDKKTGKRKNLFRTIGKVRGGRYDLLVNLQRFLSTGLIAGLSGAKHVVGFDKNPLSFLFDEKVKHRIGEGDAPHEVRRNLSLVEKLTDASDEKPRLYPTPADYERVEPYRSGPYVCMAPTSVWFTKQYPTERWVELLNRLPEEAGAVYLVGAPADRDTCQALIDQSTRANAVNLCGELNLLQSAALFEGATLTYVNDSAPLHLCSSVDAPVCAIFCSTVPAFGFGPLSRFSRVIETAKALDCRPCGLHGKRDCPQGHFDCGFGIGTETLLAVFHEALIFRII